MLIYYDIYESDGSDPKWYVGTVATVGRSDNLITRNSAIRQARKILHYGFKIHTVLSTKENFNITPLRN